MVLSQAALSCSGSLDIPADGSSKNVQRRFLREARERFEASLARFEDGLVARLGGVVLSEQDAAHQALSQELSASLVHGQRPRFENRGALLGYTRRRLKPRCRALFETILAEDSRCVLRRLLRRVDAGPLCIASIGGGPGFDGVALLATLEALLGRAACVECTVFDLSEQWSESVEKVAAQTADTWGHALHREAVTLVAPMDLCSEDSQSTAAFVLAVAEADLVTFSYVLHENEAELRSGERLGGALPSILRATRYGTVLVFLDATHRLWPTLAATALEVDAHGVPAFDIIVPRGLNAHVHAMILVRKDPSSCELSCPFDPMLLEAQFQGFSAHQEANRERLRRLDQKSRSDAEPRRVD